MNNVVGTNSSLHLLDRFELSELFGFKNYVLHFGDRASNISFLYGDNGSGKSTILNLIYAILSRNLNEGNKGYIAKIPFRTLRLVLSDGTIIEFLKKDGLVGNYDITVSGTASVFASVKTAPDLTVHLNQNNDLQLYYSFIADKKIDLIYVTDDRNIKATIPTIRKVLKLEDEEDEISDLTLHRVVYRVAKFGSERKPKVDIGALTEALRDWLRLKAFQDTSSGQRTADNIYLELAHQITTPALFDVAKGLSREQLISKLSELERACARPIEYQLMPAIKFSEYQQVILGTESGKFDILSAVITPYFDSLLARNKAISPVTKIIDTFLGEINSYFVSKEVSYSVSSGLSVKGWGEKRLPFDSLSSGERQLTFLFCSSLLATDSQCLFLIDEPELSLNVKWQRMLFSSLSKLARGSATNFISASHSLEILTEHEDSVIPIGN